LNTYIKKVFIFIIIIISLVKILSITFYTLDYIFILFVNRFVYFICIKLLYTK